MGEGLFYGVCCVDPVMMVAMFLIFGTKTVRDDLRNSPSERMHCGRCSMIWDFRRRRGRLFFTLFFLPFFPISKPQYVLTCNRCGTDRQARRPGTPGDSVQVTCPHCGERFTVSVDKA
jgi:hypothetical protein